MHCASIDKKSKYIIKQNKLHKIVKCIYIYIFISKNNDIVKYQSCYKVAWAIQRSNESRGIALHLVLWALRDFLVERSFS